MPVWPLKNKQKKLPEQNEAGVFWEDRGDRYHCGTDLYAPHGAEVFAIEKGRVVESDIMTSPEMIPYWNITYYVIVENEDGSFWKYGEMDKIFVKAGDIINEGELLGNVGLVLNSDKIDDTSPHYIQKLKYKNPSMLHLELFSDNPIRKDRNYLGGNWFNDQKPQHLLNPASILEKLL